MTKKLDDWSRHCGGDFPVDLPPEAGATHIGMFFAWIILSGMEGENDFEDMDRIKTSFDERSSTPGAVLLRFRDGKLLDDDFNKEGKSFAIPYYENANRYFGDYERALGGEYESLYHVPDSWETFDKLRVILDARFDQWKHGVV